MKFRFPLFLIAACVIVSVASATPVTELITSSGSWTAPTNVFVIQAVICGGGGGALGGNWTQAGYIGYNSSCTNLADYAVTPGKVYTITIGAGSLGTPGSTSSPIDADSTPGGGQTVAFGVTASGGGGAYGGFPRPLDGADGYLTSFTLAKAGGSGYGNLTYASRGGYAGRGYGAAGGAGGQGGIGGHGGDGGNGAPGVVAITYDTDSSNIMFSGTVYDAQTSATISGASLSFTQGSSTYTTTSGAGGTFTVLSSNGVVTGYTLVESISKAGYYTQTITFVPYVSEVIPQNIALIPTTFNKYANGTISGLIYDQYGSSISGATVTLTNSTGGILTASGTAQGFYYFPNVPKNTQWYAKVNATGYNETYTTFNMGNY